MKKIIAVLFVMLCSVAAFAQESEIIDIMNNYLESKQLEEQAFQHLLQIIPDKNAEIAELETELDNEIIFRNRKISELKDEIAELTRLYDASDSTTIQLQAMQIERLQGLLEEAYEARPDVQIILNILDEESRCIVID